MIKRIVVVLVTAAVAAAAAVGIFDGHTAFSDWQARKLATAPSAHTLLQSSDYTVMQAPDYTVGVVTTDLPSFDRSCGCAPNTSVKYIPIGEAPPSPVLTHQVLENHATPLIELEPKKTSLSDIIAGKEDAWLTAYAQIITSQQAEILMSFAPEPNGHWYTWGWPNVQPATEVAAWRHVVTVFRKAGATNVKWVWIANTIWAQSGPLPQLWPGADYVDEAGIDGYFRKDSDTFDSIFGPTITQIRQFTDKKILITETAANTTADQARVIPLLTQGVAQYKLAGFIWFDINQAPNMLGRADWAVTDTPSAMTQFKAIVKRYERTTG